MGRQKKTAGEREEAMRSMFVQGVVMGDIAEKFGISRQRVQQVLKKFFGLHGKDGGKRVVVAMKAEQRHVDLEARIQARWGVAVDVWRQARQNGLLRAFEQQRNTARNRGIPFRLTFKQWLDIWTASGKLEMRGRGKGKYVMSRLKDLGAYEVGNVHIQLAVVNSAEGRQKARAHADVTGVYLLYPGAKKPYVAKVGHVYVGSYETQESALAAREAYCAANGAPAKRFGCGKGWTFVARMKSRPYFVQVAGTKGTYHATQEEAEAEYRRRVAVVLAGRSTEAEAA